MAIRGVRVLLLDGNEMIFEIFIWFESVSKTIQRLKTKIKRLKIYKKITLESKVIFSRILSH
jgi:hypothetical protein